MVLLCAAGLLMRSLNKMQQQDFGFQTKDRYVIGNGDQRQLEARRAGETHRSGEERPHPGPGRRRQASQGGLMAVVRRDHVARWLEGYDQQRVFQSIRCPVLLLQADAAAGGMLADALISSKSIVLSGHLPFAMNER